MDLNTTSVAITGAGSGLGAATARRFAKAGSIVACLDLDPDAASRIATDINGTGYAVDVSDCAAVESVFSQI